MKKLFIPIIFLCCLSCAKSSDCQTDQSKRKGANCNDGTYTTVTGSGACSGHGGVKAWDCK